MFKYVENLNFKFLAILTLRLTEQISQFKDGCLKYQTILFIQKENIT